MRTTFPFTSSIVIILAILLIVQVGSLLVSSQSGEAIRQHANNAGASLLPSSSSSPNNKGIGRKSTLLLFHRNGERLDHAQIMRLDNQRVAFLQSNLSNGDQTLSSGKVTLPAKSGDSLGLGDYVINISLGTPKKRLTVIFDTGSDLTWTKCQPCAVSCSKQDDPIFDPSQSSSYTNVLFKSQECTQLAYGTSEPPTPSGPNCYYGNRYADDSYTYGFFATETLSLSSSRNDEIKHFQFGCGRENKATFRRVAGMMGFGHHKISVVQQTVRKYGRSFSYCLPDIKSRLGYVSLGIDAGSHTAFTKMLTLERRPSSYGIELVAISVNENRLYIHPSVFSEAGTIIDSGTVITRLPQPAYKALRNAFREAMGRTRMVTQPKGSDFDTCYDRRSIKEPIPSVTFTFAKDVKVILKKRKNIFYTINEKNCECLAFRGNADDTTLGIYGHHQQLGFEVIHDLKGERIAFVPDMC